MSQILVSNVKEAGAAEEAGVDLILARADDNFRNIRLAAPKTFITAAIPFIKYSNKEKIAKFQPVEFTVPCKKIRFFYYHKSQK